MPSRPRPLVAPADTTDPSRTAAAGNAYIILHGLYWLTVHLAAAGPLVVVVDDLHWADAPSLRFLLYLVRRLPRLPPLVILATRPEEPGPAGPCSPAWPPRTAPRPSAPPS